MFLDTKFHENQIKKLMHSKRINFFESYFLYTNLICENYKPKQMSLVEMAFLPMLLRSLAAGEIKDYISKNGDTKTNEDVKETKQKALQWITDSLTLDGGIVDVLTDNIDAIDDEDLPKLFSDKEYLTTFLFDSIIQHTPTALSKYKGDENGFIMSVFSSLMKDAESDDDMADKMKAVLYDIVVSKMGSTLDKIKNSIFGA